MNIQAPILYDRYCNDTMVPFHFLRDARTILIIDSTTLGSDSYIRCQYAFGWFYNGSVTHGRDISKGIFFSGQDLT